MHNNRVDAIFIRLSLINNLIFSIDFFGRCFLQSMCSFFYYICHTPYTQFFFPLFFSIIFAYLFVYKIYAVYCSKWSLSSRPLSIRYCCAHSFCRRRILFLQPTNLLFYTLCGSIVKNEFLFSLVFYLKH